VVPTGAANPTTGSTASASSSSAADTGLSGGAKAGIAIAAAVGGLLLVALLVFLVVRNNRRKRRDMESERILEADSTPAVPPYSAEMPPNEKKVPVEMPSAAMVAVEAPGDAHWPHPQELPGDFTHSEMEGSSPSQQKDDIKTVVSSETKTLVGSDAKLDIKSNPESQP